MSDRRLPVTDSIQELARFWDSHDLTDFTDALEEVGEPVFAGGTLVQVRLLPEDANAMEGLARSRGTDVASLIHEWVRERLREAS